MAQVSNRKDVPLSMRLSASDMAIIDRAATIRGRSRTEFARDTMVRAAEEVIMDNQPIRMSPEGFAQFLQAISAPPQAAPEMVRFMTKQAPWESN